MLDAELANKIIERLADCTDYNINIMNEKGIIIASKDKSRIGTFHEVAFEIISKGLEVREVKGGDTFLGAKRGINMALKYKKKTIGVLGLTEEGAEERKDNIHSVANVVKRMMETILEYEANKEEFMKRKTDKERFINSLLYEEIDKKDLQAQAQMLGYSDGLRIPIRISFKSPVNLKDMVAKISSGTNGRKDIVFTSKDGRILIFKSYTETIEGFFENYKYTVGEYLSVFLRYVAENEIDCKICIGSLQESMVNYKVGFQHCLWLEKYHTMEKRSIFFYDYLDEYLKQQLPFMELHKLFEVFAKQYSSEFKKLYMEHIGALYENNYNMQESSRQLYIHKNTLAFRLDKIKTQLGLNPMQNAQDRELVNYFYYYLKQLS